MSVRQSQVRLVNWRSVSQWQVRPANHRSDLPIGCPIPLPNGGRILLCQSQVRNLPISGPKSANHRNEIRQSQPGLPITGPEDLRDLPNAGPGLVQNLSIKGPACQTQVEICQSQDRLANQGSRICQSRDPPAKHGAEICQSRDRPAKHGPGICQSQAWLAKHRSSPKSVNHRIEISKSQVPNFYILSLSLGSSQPGRWKCT